jgi:hypothetical protein
MLRKKSVVLFIAAVAYAIFVYGGNIQQPDISDVSGFVTNAFVVELSISDDWAVIKKREAWIWGTSYRVSEYLITNKYGAVTLAEIPSNAFERVSSHAEILRNQAGIFMRVADQSPNMNNPTWVQCDEAGDIFTSFILPSLGLMTVPLGSVTSTVTGQTLVVTVPFTNGAKSRFTIDRKSRAIVDYLRFSTDGVVYSRSVDPNAVISTNILSISGAHIDQSKAAPDRVIELLSALGVEMKAPSNDSGDVISIPEHYQSYGGRPRATSFTTSYGGIGVWIKKLKSGETVVTQVVSNSPAQRAGMLPDDIILKVDQIDGSSASIGELANAIRGPTNIPVTVVFMREGTKMTVDVPREAISLKGEADSIRPNNLK